MNPEVTLFLLPSNPCSSVYYFLTLLSIKKTFALRMSFSFCLVLVIFSSLAQNRIMGLRWEDKRYEQEVLKLNYDVPSKGLPSLFSVKQFCPPVINQGSSNAGVALATVWYGRTMVESIACNNSAKSFQESYNGFFNHRLLADDCTQPISIMDLLLNLKQQGARKFKEFREVCPDSIKLSDLAGTKEHALSGYNRLFQTFDSREIKVNAIRHSLYNGNAVVLGVTHTPSLDIATDVWQVGDQVSRGQGGHALCVVGYDDAKYGGAFEVVNTWGKSWGKEGFTWIRYEDVKQVAVYGFELFDTKSEGCAEKDISAQIQFMKTTGESMPGTSISKGFYTLSGSYPNKTEFTIRLNATGKMYAYVVFADPNNSFFSVFPQEEQLLGNSFTNHRQEIKLPLGSLPFTLEPPTGVNHFIFIFSGSELNPQDIVQRLNTTTGDLGQRLEIVNKNSPIPKAISWQDEMKFTATVEKDFSVSMAVRLTQIE